MVLIKVSVGELIDKYSILQIKKTNITDTVKIEKVEKEINALLESVLFYLRNENINTIYKELLKVNTELWNTEDALRILEKQKKFDDSFISYARNVYYLNDQRYKLKNDINLLTDSDIKEVKEYINYH